MKINFEELETLLIVQTEHLERQLGKKNKELQKAYVEGMRTALAVLTDYKLAFDKDSKKIVEIEE